VNLKVKINDDLNLIFKKTVNGGFQSAQRLYGTTVSTCDSELNALHFFHGFSDQQDSDKNVTATRSRKLSRTPHARETTRRPDLEFHYVSIPGWRIFGIPDRASCTTRLALRSLFAVAQWLETRCARYDGDVARHLRIIRVGRCVYPRKVRTRGLAVCKARGRHSRGWFWIASGKVYVGPHTLSKLSVREGLPAAFLLRIRFPFIPRFPPRVKLVYSTLQIP